MERRNTINSCRPIQAELTTVFNRSQEKGFLSGINSLDEILLGFHKQRLYVVGAAAKAGKAQPLTSNILTPTGWKLMGELQIGNKVFAADGSVTYIEGIYSQGIRPVYQIKMKDGSITECDKEHLWQVQNGISHYQTVLKTTNELQTNLKVKKGKYFRSKWGIRRCNPIQFSNKILSIHPYLLGVYLGDGWTYSSSSMLYIDYKDVNKIQLLLPDTDILSESSTHNNFRVKRKKRMKTTPSQFYTYLKNLGLNGKRSYEKFIPQNYLFGDIEQRKQLLQGLLDTDGYQHPTKKKEYEYSTTSKQLAEDVKFLVKSLGGLCSITSRRGRYKKDNKYTNCRINYRVYLTLGSKKQQYIDSIIYIGIKPCQCIKINHSSGLYITDDFIVTHNTSLLTDIAINVSKSVPVVMFSLEQSFDEIQKRIVCNVATANNFKVQQGQCKEQIERAIPAVSKLSLWIDDRTNVIYSGDIVRYLKEQGKSLPEESLNMQIDFHARDGVKLVIIDYLNLIRLAGRNERDDLRVHQIMWQLHTMAKHYQIPIITACQLNRESRKSGERPQLTGLKDSTHIEADCDVVIMIHRPNYYEQQIFDKTEDAIEHNAELIVAANRSGPTGIAIVDWFGFCCSFRNKKEEF